MILLKIRGSCISYASFKKKEETRLENEIMSITKHLEDNLNENNVHQLEEKRQELIELRKKKVDGMIVRSRAKWIYTKVNRIQNIFVIFEKDILYRAPSLRLVSQKKSAPLTLPTWIKAWNRFCTIQLGESTFSNLTSYKSVKAMLFVHISLEKKEWISCNVFCIM